MWTDGVNFYDKKHCDFQIGWREATQEEVQAYLDSKNMAAKIAEAKQYLADTDYKMLADYEPKEGGESVESIKIKRAEAREFVRANS